MDNVLQDKQQSAGARAGGSPAIYVDGALDQFKCTDTDIDAPSFGKETSADLVHRKPFIILRN